MMAIYMAALSRAMLVWAKRDGNSSQSLPNLKVSIILPFRNEAENLPNLLSSLAAQNYPDLEVIFVNDHSEDASVQVLEKALQSFPFPYQLPGLTKTTGKKAAIEKAVSVANGEIILTTDADCEMGEDWVKEMIRPFANEKVKMVSGPLQLTGKGLFQRWQKMEFATLITLGAVSVRSGKPTMANGANLAYRKEVFQALHGFEDIMHTPSGDDELLMMKVSKAYPKGVVFRKSKAAIVSTMAIPNWQGLKQQRLRWASKWKVGKRPATQAMALFVFLLNLSWLLLPLFSYLGWVAPEAPIRVYSIRFIIEAIWVMCLAGFFHQAISVRALIIHQFLYPFYVVYFGLMANFGNFQWKGRNYPVQVQ